MIDVTVVIATRNRKDLLREAIASVRSQAGVAWELIVVNDASDDDTWQFLSGETGLRSFNQPARGERSRARNVGLENARGRFIMFLDDDDLLMPDALATLTRALDSQSEAVAAAGARLDWFVHEKWVRRDSHPRFPRTRPMYDALLFGWSAISGQCLYRTDVVRDVGGYNIDITYTEDRDLWLKIARLGPVVLRPETVMTYRIPRVQDRPPDIAEVRERTVQNSINRIPEEEQPAARAIRRSSVFIDHAEEQLRRSQPLLAARSVVRAFAISPRLLLTPIVGGWVLRRLARGAGHLLKVH